MNDGGGRRRVRGGQNLLTKLSKPAECKEDKRLLCVSATAVCERRAAEEEGKVDALGQRRRVGGAEGERNSKADLKRTRRGFAATSAENMRVCSSLHLLRGQRK